MLSVVICTWNRAASLRRALASHVDADVPRGIEWELIVVDNGSTDDTAQVVAEFETRLPVRHVAAPVLGLSLARNVGVHAARGTHLLWMDDDVVVSPNWIAAYAEAIAKWPAAAVFGGPILPRFEDKPAKWFLQALPVVSNAYALFEAGNQALPFTHSLVPFGANYVVRAAEQRRHLYSPTLGRRGDNLAGGEETTVIRAILREGGTGWYVPSATVGHVISPSRQTVRYLRRYYADNAPMPQHMKADGVPMLFGRPRWLWRALVQQELLYRITRWFASPDRWAWHLRQASGAWGELRPPSSVRTTRYESTASSRKTELF